MYFFFFVKFPTIEFQFRFKEKYHDILLSCCTTGEEYAEKENNCKGFQLSSTVPSELIGACFFSAEICCTSKLRIEQCKLGVQAAKSGTDCHITANQTGTEFYKNCCEACKVGLIVGAMQEECSMGVLYGIPFDDSYNFCCNEMKTGDSFVLTDDDSKFSANGLFRLNFFKEFFHFSCSIRYLH